MHNKIKTTLYHGTVSKINAIDVSCGRDYKDFGKGFYMAISKNQAIGMMHKKNKEVIKRHRNKDDKQDISYSERLYEITLDENYINKLKIKIFKDADIEWLDFVLMCRQNKGIPHDYDIVIGPTADDNTALCLKYYLDGVYGNPSSDEAKKILLNNLETENLGVQCFIGRQDVVDNVVKSIKEVNWR